MISLLAIFWGSIFCVGYSYVLFPFILQWLSKNKQQNTLVYNLNDDELPRISILLAVYNEELVIEQKIKSTFATSYPLSKISFLIGSDSSTDATDAIIKTHQQQFPNLQLHVFPKRTG